MIELNYIEIDAVSGGLGILSTLIKMADSLLEFGAGFVDGFSAAPK